MTEEELLTEIHSLHPSNIDSQMEMLKSALVEYRVEKEKAHKLYEMMCNNIAEANCRLTQLFYYKERLKRLTK